MLIDSCEVPVLTFVVGAVVFEYGSNTGAKFRVGLVNLLTDMQALWVLTSAGL